MAVKLIHNTSKYTGTSFDTKPTSVGTGSTFWEYDTRDLYITYDGTNWVVKTYGEGGDSGTEWIFGKPILETGGVGRASWTQSTTASVSDRNVWAVKLDAGKQTGYNDYAKVVIPVNEMAFTALSSVRLQAKYTVGAGVDMGVCVYIHDPDDLDQRVEISHTTLTNSAAGTREIDYPDNTGIDVFYYGTLTDVPDTCPDAGKSYTWANFQADSVFSTWTIYKITLDYGYYTGNAVMNGCYLYHAEINNIVIRLEPSLEERVNLAIDASSNAIKSIPTWTFGEPTLMSALGGDAVWSRASDTETTAAYQKGNTGWVANLFGGNQALGHAGESWGAVYVPVNEMPLPDLLSALWTYNFSAAEEHGVNMVIWVHDPVDFDRRVEITQAPSAAGLERASGWNAHELSTATTQFFYIGELVDTPDTCPAARTQYTLAQFQGDSVFSRFTIYRISFEYGWYSTGVFNDAWVADIEINGEKIALKPDSTGTGRIGHRFFTDTTGAIDDTEKLAPMTPFRLLSCMLHLDSAATTETFTITCDAGRVADLYDTLIYSVSMSGVQDIIRTFGEGYDFLASDEIDPAWTNTDARTYGITWTYQTVF